MGDAAQPATVQLQKAVASTLGGMRWAMRSRAHLAWLETALDTLTLALIAATVVLLVGLL